MKIKFEYHTNLFGAKFSKYREFFAQLTFNDSLLYHNNKFHNCGQIGSIRNYIYNNIIPSVKWEIEWHLKEKI